MAEYVVDTERVLYFLVPLDTFSHTQALRHLLCTLTSIPPTSIHLAKRLLRGLTEHQPEKQSNTRTYCLTGLTRTKIRSVMLRRVLRSSQPVMEKTLIGVTFQAAPIEFTRSTETLKGREERSSLQRELAHRTLRKSPGYIV